MNMTVQKLKEIPFTQYLTPGGKAFSQLQMIDRPEEVADKAYQVIAEGYQFTVELDRGTVYMECVPKDAPSGAICKVQCGNGPGVLKAVDQLIDTAYSQIQEWENGTR